MKKSNIYYYFVILFFMAKILAYAQSTPIMYFCEYYDDEKGEVNISDRFVKGNFTIMIKSHSPIAAGKVEIEIDKYDCDSSKFSYYKGFEYNINESSTYLFFEADNENDLSINDAGFYRIFLLDEKFNTITSALIEIIE